MTTKQIVVYGLGAIGSNLLLQIAKQRPEIAYVGIDFDKVEARNIGPQAYFLEHIGQDKAVAMRGVLARFLRKPRYHPISDKLTKEPGTEPEDVLNIDCFDNVKSRALTCTSALKNTLHVGFSPFYTAEIAWSPGYKPSGDVAEGAPDICTLQAAVPFIHTVVNLAALTVTDFLLHGRKRDSIVSVNINNGTTSLNYTS